MFSQSGRVKRDSLEDKAFMALSISITTKLPHVVSLVPYQVCFRGNTYMDKETVEAALLLSFANISQPISGNWDEHR